MIGGEERAAALAQALHSNSWTWESLALLVGIDDDDPGSGSEALKAALRQLEEVTGAAWAEQPDAPGVLFALGLAPIGRSRPAQRRLGLLGGRIRLLRSSPGFDQAVQACRYDKRQWTHLRMQIELASVATHCGAKVRFGDANRGGFSDLTLLNDGRTITVETTSIGMDRETIRSSELQDVLTTHVAASLSRLGDRCRVTIGEVLTPEALDACIGYLASIPTSPGGVVTVGPVTFDFDAEFSVHGPPLVADEGDRLITRLRSKSAQARGAPIWVVLEHSGFLFTTTTWAGFSFPDRLASLESLLRGVGDLAGVVLTTAGPLRPEANATVRTASGATAIRLPGREAHMIPLHEGTGDVIDMWLGLYRNEAEAEASVLRSIGLAALA